jgi:hypothetical protein
MPTYTKTLRSRATWLKINQNCRGFHPYSERINFLNCISNILSQMLEVVPKEGST